jgi:hypothetical protein
MGQLTMLGATEVDHRDLVRHDGQLPGAHGHHHRNG